MSDNLKRNLLLGLALAAVIAGIIIAVAPGGSHHGSSKTKHGISHGSTPGDPQLAAEYLGISRGALRRRLRGGETMGQIADATPGRSAGGLVAALLAARTAQLKAEKHPTKAEHEALARARAQIVAETGHRRGRSGPIPSAAAYLGLTPSQLRARLHSGKSLAEVARAEQKSPAGLIAALVAVKANRLKTALKEHAISPARERAALARLKTRVRRQVNARSAPASG